MIFAGLLHFRAQSETLSERVKFWLDALTTMVGGGLLFWYFLIDPIARSQDSTALAALVAAAYPVADLVLLLGIATVALGTAYALRRWTCLLLGLALASFMVGDIAYASLNVSGQYVAGEPLTLLSEIPFQVSYLLLTVAALRGLRDAKAVVRGGAASNRPPSTLSALPYVAVALGYGLLLWVSFGDLPESVQGLIIGAVALTALVVARQVVAVRENARLLMAQTARRSEARFRLAVPASIGRHHHC